MVDPNFSTTDLSAILTDPVWLDEAGVISARILHCGVDLAEQDKPREPLYIFEYFAL